MTDSATLVAGAELVVGAELLVGADAAEALGFSEPKGKPLEADNEKPLEAGNEKPLEAGNEVGTMVEGADLGTPAENPKLVVAELVLLGSDVKGAVVAGVPVEEVEKLVEVVEVTAVVLDTVVDVVGAVVAGKLGKGVTAASLGFSVLSFGFSAAFLSPNRVVIDRAVGADPKPEEVADGIGVAFASLAESFAWVLPVLKILLVVDAVALVEPRLGVAPPKEKGAADGVDDEAEVSGAGGVPPAGLETSAGIIDVGLLNGKEDDPLSFFSSPALPEALKPPDEN